MVETEKILRSKGLKVTPQRLAIYSMLSKTKEHPSAEDVYKKLLPDNPSISLATVYKTLDSFKNIGLVQELSVGNGRCNYDADVTTHPHFVCDCCGKIDDLEIDMDFLLKDTISQITDATDYQIDSQQITFHGTCPCCKN